MTGQVEDRQAIEQLMALYAHYGDRGFAGAGADAGALAALFTEDGIWESGTLARFEGREAIAAGVGKAPVAFVVHLLLNPILTVEGDAAEGRWKAILLLTGKDGGARWGVSRYSVRYRRTADGWRIAHLTAGSIAWMNAGPFEINI